jgi:hypothetical protein
VDDYIIIAMIMLNMNHKLKKEHEGEVKVVIDKIPKWRNQMESEYSAPGKSSYLH